MKCPKCGKEMKEHYAEPIPEGYEECSYCGALIKKKSKKKRMRA